MFEPEKSYLSELDHDMQGKVEWSSPSNIALVKYWGKKAVQEPQNPNLSFSLTSSRTNTSVGYSFNRDAKSSWNFLFEGKPNPSFEKKISRFLDSAKPWLPFLSHAELHISSSNTFPHSAGIASSASAMSALSLCLLNIEYELMNREPEGRDFYQKASFLSRLGSGSAARSVYPGFSVWGKNSVLQTSSDLFAVPYEIKGSSFFEGIYDAILITSSGEKPVSSSLGHVLMDKNPYAATRYKEAAKNLEILIDAIDRTDREAFIDVVEKEALSLHGLMMTSEPGYILMNGGSIEIIRKIREFRKQSSAFITFTLDAGPNVHLLYHKSDKSRIENFIVNDLIKYTEKDTIIWDRIGSGPEKAIPTQ